jgi:hypothetical protein
MDATLIAALITVAGAAAATMGHGEDRGQLGFIADNWSDIARALRERGTPEQQIQRFRGELFAAL